MSSVRRPICKKQSVTQIVQVACPKILPSPGLIASVSTLARIFFCCKLARASLATLIFKPGGENIYLFLTVTRTLLGIGLIAGKVGTDLNEKSVSAFGNTKRCR